jgi:PHD/YefM family antitoxin component YafN of YafNO toxin-antitoxin module
LLTSYWAAPSTAQAEALLEILAQRATARETQSLHCNKVDKFMVL